MLGDPDQLTSRSLSIRGNLRSISGILSQWCKEPIISRAKGSKPMALDEFDLKHKERVGMRTLIQYRTDDS